MHRILLSMVNRKSGIQPLVGDDDMPQQVPLVTKSRPLSAVGRGDVLIALVLALLSMAWSVMATHQGTQLSRLDEWTYIDYAWKASHGHLPVSGEPLGMEARAEWSCRGMEGNIRDVVPPSCEDVPTASPERWPYKGENYNAFHPPFYFFAAGLAAQALSAITGVAFVTAARLLCGLVVSLGIGAVYLAIRRWRVGRVAAFSGALLVLATPGIAASGAMMHSEAINALAGAAAVWFGARVLLEHRLDWKLPALATLLITMMRTISVTAMLSMVGLVVLSLAWPAIGGFARDVRKKLALIVATQFGAVVIGFLPWTIWQNGRTPPEYIADTTGFSTVPYGSFSAFFPSLFGGYGLTESPFDWFLQQPLNSTLLLTWAQLLFWFYMLLPFVALAVAGWRGTHQMLAGSALIGPFVSAVVVQGREILTKNAYFPYFSARYALSTVALSGAAAASLFDQRILRWILLVFASASYLILMASPFLPS